MNQENIFELIALVKSAKGDPSAVVDAVWAAGYRQPPRTEQEAAKITIDTFFECNMHGIPAQFWPDDYDSVLCNELMRAVLADYEDCSLFDLDSTKVAKSILAAGFTKVVANDAA